MRLLACSIAAKTYSRAPGKVIVSRNSHTSSASVWERRNAAYVVALAFGCRVDPGVAQDLPDSGGGDLHARDQQFPAYVAVSPRRVLAHQPPDQQADSARRPLRGACTRT
jgi:hypothetical protein